jgi:hypothetical protein
MNVTSGGMTVTSTEMTPFGHVSILDSTDLSWVANFILDDVEANLLP